MNKTELKQFVADLYQNQQFVDKFRFFESGYRKGPLMDKNCYANAYWGVKSNSNNTYCEGWACRKDGHPVRHAWVVDDTDSVIDVTVNFDIYFGVKIKTDWLIQNFEDLEWEPINYILMENQIEVAIKE